MLPSHGSAGILEGLENARDRAFNDTHAIAAHAVAILAAMPRVQIVDTAQLLWDVMADSYRADRCLPDQRRSL
jgi:hypothetical protein